MKRVSRHEIVEILSKEVGISKEKANHAIQVFNRVLIEQLKKKREIAFKGLFRLGVKKYKAKICHNFHTGQQMKVEKRDRPFVKFSRSLILGIRNGGSNA